MKKTSAHKLYLIAAMSIFISSCHHDVTQVRPVRAEQIKPTTLLSHYSYAGVVRAHNDVTLSFQVGGKISNRYVEIGESVAPGKLLAELDAKDLTLDVENIDAQLKSAKSTLLLSQNDLNRYKQLLSQGHISDSFFQDAKTKFETNSATVERIQASLQLAKRKLNYTKLYAEYPGIITKTLANAGQVVSPGQAVIQMARSDEKEIVINIPEQRIEQWQYINNVTVTLWAHPAVKYDAKIREISGEADPVTRTYVVKLSMTNPDKSVRLGMTANVEADEHTERPQILIPLTAVYYENNNPSVWIVNQEDMTVQPTKILLGGYEDNKIIVKGGLLAGQWIVTAGVNSLRKGQKVKLVDE